MEYLVRKGQMLVRCTVRATCTAVASGKAWEYNAMVTATAPRMDELRCIVDFYERVRDDLERFAAS
jgi:hypothetical protein